MKTIHKFPLKARGTIEIPVGARPLCAQFQGDILVLWAEVHTDREMESRECFVVGTGTLVPDAAACYVGTVQEPPFVWHVYLSQGAFVR